MTSCRTCASVRGDDPISPVEPIFVGKHWNVEHGWPTALVGWVVLPLRRHAEALHELSPEEFGEFAELLRVVTGALHQVTGCVKEYASCFAEAEGFAHVHVHLVPRAPDLPPHLRGPRVFGLLGPDELADEAEVRSFCEGMRRLVTAEIAR